MTSALTAKVEDRRWDGPNRFAAGVHEAEARRHRGDKDSPVRQSVDAGGRIGSAIGHALFVAQAAPVPREKETFGLGRHGRRRPRTASGRRGTTRLCKVHLCDGVSVGRPVPAHAFEGGSIENVDRRDIIVADRQPFAVRTESDAVRAMSARRPDRLADAAKVWAVVLRVVLVEANQSVIGRRRETAVGRERCAVASSPYWSSRKASLQSLSRSKTRRPSCRRAWRRGSGRPART